jgi:hypothetical protein
VVFSLCSKYSNNFVFSFFYTASLHTSCQAETLASLWLYVHPGRALANVHKIHECALFLGSHWRTHLPGCCMQRLLCIVLTNFGMGSGFLRLPPSTGSAPVCLVLDE